MPSTGLPFQTQLLVPLELSNSLGGSFAVTAPYLPGMLTCFHGIELPHWKFPGAQTQPRASLLLSAQLIAPAIALAVPQGPGWLLLPSTRGGPARPPSQISPRPLPCPWKPRLTPLSSHSPLSTFVLPPLGSSGSPSVKSITIPTSGGGCKSK